MCMAACMYVLVWIKCSTRAGLLLLCGQANMCVSVSLRVCGCMHLHMYVCACMLVCNVSLCVRV